MLNLLRLHFDLEATNLNAVDVHWSWTHPRQTKISLIVSSCNGIAFECGGHSVVLSTHSLVRTLLRHPRCESTQSDCCTRSLGSILPCRHTSRRPGGSAQSPSRSWRTSAPRRPGPARAACTRPWRRWCPSSRRTPCPTCCWCWPRHGLRTRCCHPPDESLIRLLC